MAAASKEELLAVTRKEFDKLERLLLRVPLGAAMSKDDDETSIKDVIAHRAHWIGLFLGWYTDGLAGHEVHFPAEGYKWNELKRYNSELRSTQAALGWDDACRQLRAAHSILVEFHRTPQ